MTTTVMQTTLGQTTTQTPQTQTTAQGTAPAAPAAPALTPADVQIALSTFLRRVPGRGGGGGSGGGGGPPPPAGPPQPAQGQHVPPAGAGNVRTMGQLPRVFSGDRSQANDFIDELKSYLLLNYQVAGFNSPITKVALALTLIKGPEVAGWARDMRLWLESFDPTTQNLPAIWNAFLAEFATQFQDTQQPNRVRIELESLKMKPGEIDQYLARFEELAHQALYNIGDEATTSLFLKGLPAGILIDVFKPPIITTYKDIKQQAIQSTKSRIIIDSILGMHQGGQPSCPQGNRRSFQGAFQSLQNVNNQNQPGLPTPPRNNQPITSSNAPRWMNNMAVPMDLSRARAPTWRGRGRGQSFGRLADMNGGRNSTCFNCGKEGHFTRNCQLPRHAGANSSYTTEDLINLDDAYTEAESIASSTLPVDPVASMKAQLNAMTFEDKAKLAQELGTGNEEDFPLA